MKASEEIKLILSGYKRSEILELKKREAEESQDGEPDQPDPKTDPDQDDNSGEDDPGQDDDEGENDPGVDAPDEKDFQTLYEQMKAENEKLQNDLKAAQKNNVNNSGKPVDTFKQDSDMLLESLRNFS